MEEKTSNQLIIAEAGINHNGKLDLALELIRQAKNIGADIIKFQTFSHISHLNRYELKGGFNDFYHLKRECDKNKIEFMSTPHTFEAIHFLDDIVSRYKIASTYLTNPNFLKVVASKNRPIFLSTGNPLSNNGMSTIEEIRNALSYIPDAKVTLMHCVSLYPCKNPYYERIRKLKYLGYDVGLSDHSKTIKVPKGLTVVEKHLMLDDNWYDERPLDECVSIRPNEFKEMVEWLKSM